ncbi:heat shock protein beta-1-like [Bacillus rossius redtenbacheri]|uniref:heat shock protein beta-1-like n=1 Tax=Bacillus rossius redtenbacheri TaxID=93214 RepID=UPI002FDD53B4
MRSIITDVNRQMERLERDFINFSPLRCLMPRAIPIQGTGAAFDAYRVNIDVQGYKPEEISISLKDGVLSVRAQMERSAEDGSKFYQEVKREFTLPDNIEQRSLKSFLSRDGVLCVEAPFKSEEKSKEIPVSQE